jgi:FixJ family two-component response regulator
MTNLMELLCVLGVAITIIWKIGEQHTLLTQKAIFVVDDDPSMLKGVGRLLRLHGFQTVLFNSADALRTHGNLDRAFCMVLDINLGDASGIELRRWLAQSAGTVPIIFITGNDDHATRKAAIQSGCISFLTKPFSAKSLIGAIVASVSPAQHPAWRDQSSPEGRKTASP